MTDQEIDKIKNALMKYSDKRSIEILKHYKRAQVDILKQVTKVITQVIMEDKWTWELMSKYNRFDKMMNEINSIIKTLGKAEQKDLKNLLTDIYKEEYARKQIELYYTKQGKTWEEIQKEFDLADYNKSYYSTKFNISMINADKINIVLSFPWAGSNFSDTIWNEKDKLIKTIRNELTQSMIQGEGITKASQRVRNIMGNSAYNCRRLVRTETMRMSNEAHIQAMDKAGYNKVQWFATGDERVCPICKKYHEQIYPINDKPKMPAHPNCRCTWLAIIQR